MILSQDVLDKLQYYEQAYFYIDDPVPFRNNLKVYPVMARDYYKFYSNLSALTMDKTTKKVVQKNPITGQDETKFAPNIEGISMSNMRYLINQMLNKEYGQLITQQVINMFELCLHEKNGLFCPKCGKRIDSEQLFQKLQNFDKEILSADTNLTEEEKKIKKYEFLQNIGKCECGENMREIYSIKDNNGTKSLCIYDYDLNNSDFEELVGIITHQNILDYDDDKYMDPNLKADLERKKQLENKNYSSPSLEKQLICVSISSPYTIEQLKEQVTLRKLSYMLKVVDAKNYYYAQIQGAMSGMVSFKAGSEPKHWIFSDNKTDVSKEIMSMNDIQNKFAGAAKM